MQSRLETVPLVVITVYNTIKHRNEMMARIMFEIELLAMEISDATHVGLCYLYIGFDLELPWPSGYELRLSLERSRVIGGRQEGHPVQKMLTALPKVPINNWAPS